MIGKALTSSLVGVDAKLINIEVDILPSQLPGLTVVGLPDKTVQEAKERIISSIKNSGLEWPRKRIIINLAPADIPKTGTSFDLPIAIAILHATDQVNCDSTNTIISGELSLEGEIRPINGALSIGLTAKEHKIKTLIVPKQNAAEAALVKGIQTIGVSSLKELVEHLNDLNTIKPTNVDYSSLVSDSIPEIDMKYIKGQHYVKRAAEIAASGGHNMLLSGTPGSGKTFISKALSSILPDLTFEEALEVTKIYSIAGLLSENQALVSKRPFRAPHHTASTTSIIGGGAYPKPGELSLSHRGILFLDEFPEFSSFTLESLRQPLEDKKVVISRVSGTLTFPSNFMLIAAMNPCKCGWRGDPDRECICTPGIIEKYKKKISGPILDRIDLQMNVARVKIEDLSNIKDETPSEVIKNKVQISRNIQLERFKGTNIYANAEIPQKTLDQFCKMEPDAKAILTSAAIKLNLSARSYFRIIRVARTIADLENAQEIKKNHVTESLQYRINE
jgi:magnesium chelatase family protein